MRVVLRVVLLPHFFGVNPDWFSLFRRASFLWARVHPAQLPPAVTQRLAPTKGAAIGRIASKYVRVSLPAPPPTSPPHSPALIADKAEVGTEQARPPRLDLSTPPPCLTTPHQQSRTRFPVEPTLDKVEGNRDSREPRITTTTTTAANMNHHHHHTQQQQKAGEQQLSEPEDMEMEGKKRSRECFIDTNYRNLTTAIKL